MPDKTKFKGEELTQSPYNIPFTCITSTSISMRLKSFMHVKKEKWLIVNLIETYRYDGDFGISR